MLKTTVLILFLMTSLSARENPFFPSTGEKDIPLTSNINTELSPLKRATLTLPSTARVIERVTVEYKSLDGSKHTQSIELENTIDWHLPIFVSQSYGSDERKVQRVDKTQKVKKKKSSYKKIASIKFISFYSSGKKLKVITEDKVLRDFLLVKPHRIVCDFKRETDIKSFVKEIPKNSLFTKIRIGNHKGYYRVVIELDGYYRYKMSEIEKGYIFELR
ncbi:MAG: AMIN domain-containing protein [Campylobacterota bacterium]|nr:AMIN domain-containing protein [Campylobacterota bacterium]